MLFMIAALQLNFKAVCENEKFPNRKSFELLMCLGIDVSFLICAEASEFN